MLDATTKRKIDSVRQILVGKVPDPKVQVEQITTGLVYKFMDDMDKESQELGGEAKFFSNNFQKFSWSNVLDKKLSGQERHSLYVDAITNMSKNPHIPQLFRDIFKDAFLPYNDQQTLSLFLKEIDEFTYDHSEDLGNSFEYLLSVLGSQGDAGQFRTPRHIIDFIVAVVDPKKNESILDPACGTAGFLISAYNHIRKHNSTKIDEKEGTKEKFLRNELGKETLIDREFYSGDKLTPYEKEKLIQNIVGYDISPDMVKLSLVNMYLHGFPEPKIFEYDTLTSEKHWEEQFDVIMANPPFMTPKGGIRPHKRFVVKASRSEVLFVDYILEHLNFKGRAGIIVPEGILFKNDNAYRQLRRMLVEDGLFAVVSLPQGVFNPYSGVKTSILFFDKELSKKMDEILFVMVKNDGFDLGAQRKKIEKNDLLEVFKIVDAWKQRQKIDSDLALWVKKVNVADNGKFKLVGSIYRDTRCKRWSEECEIVELGQVAEVISGLSPKSVYYNKKCDGLPFYQGKKEFTELYIGKPAQWTSKLTKIAKKGDILMSVRAPVGPVNIATQKICIGRGLAAIRPKNIEQMYLFNFLRLIEDEIKGNGGAIFDSINRCEIEKIKIPLPPIDLQREIVKQIEKKQNEITRTIDIVKNLKKERDEIIVKKLRIN